MLGLIHNLASEFICLASGKGNDTTKVLYCLLKFPAIIFC